MRPQSSCLPVGSRKRWNNHSSRQEGGIIEKVDFPTDWISAIVVAKKSNGDIHHSSYRHIKS